MHAFAIFALGTRSNTKIFTTFALKAWSNTHILTKFALKMCRRPRNFSDQLCLQFPQSKHAARSSVFFSPVKRKDTREHFGFENVHVLNFASRAVFWEMFTGKKKNHGWNFWKCSRALFTGNSIFLDLFTGRKKVSRATFVCVCKEYPP